MSLFLTPAEVGELTGYERPADQARWLRDRGWIFELNAQRRPIVLRAYAEGRMGGARSQGSAAATGYHIPPQPNFDALKTRQ